MRELGKSSGLAETLHGIQQAQNILCDTILAAIIGKQITCNVVQLFAINIVKLNLLLGQQVTFSVLLLEITDP